MKLSAGRKRVPPALTAVAGGLLTTLTVPPFGWWPLAIPGIALLVAALSQTDRRRVAFGLTMVWAAALYVPSLWWMTAFSLPGGVFVGLLEATITALTMCVVLPRERHSTTGRRATAVGVIGGLMFADSLRSLWPFGGLPLGGIDLGQANGWFAPIVAWTGRLGLVGLVAIAAVVTVELVRHLRSGAERPAVQRTAPFVRTALLVGSLGLTAAVPLGAGSPAIAGSAASVGSSDASVLVIQGGGPRGLLASPDNARRTFDAHIDTTRQALTTLRTPPALILWPENTVDTNTFTTSERYQRLKEFSGSFVSVGITEDGGPKQFLNAQVMLDPDGAVVDRYDKVRRVPFGEYFPLRSQIESLGLADLPNRDARPGTTPGTLRAGEVTYGVLISYEGFFDDRARNAVRAGAQVLLIPTNASSYKTTQLPSQQIAAAQLRALETHRDVFQAGPTGYSAFIDARGNVSDLTGLGDRQFFLRSFTPRNGRTPYVRFNDVPALVIAAGFVLAGIVVRRARS